MRSPHANVRCQAVWTLGNITAESVALRNYVLSFGAMTPLLDCFGDMSCISVVRVAAWLLHNFCRGTPQPVLPALGVLGSLCDSNDDRVLNHACWALCYLSTVPTNNQALLDAGVLSRLVQLLLDPSAFNVQMPVLRCVGNIIANGDEKQTQQVLDANVLAPLAKLLVSTNHSVQKEACWVISNITAGTHLQIQAVIDSGAVPPLVSLLGAAPLAVKKEAFWALSNAILSGEPAQVDYLVQRGTVRPLVDMLASQGDDQIVASAFQSLDTVLRVCRHSAAARTASADALDRLGGALLFDAALTLRLVERCDVESIFKSDLLPKVASLPHAALTLEAKKAMARVVFICHDSASPRQLDVLADLGFFNRMYVIRDRAASICVGLQQLDLPALVTLELLDVAFPNDIPMHKKWQLVTAAKHFHRR
jgi:hypothetical protein